MDDVLAVDPEQVSRQARALLDVVDEVARVRLAEAALAISAALPGSDSSHQAQALAEAWDRELRAWTRQATRVAEAIDETLRDFAATDGQVADALARIGR